jgi:tryptophan 6-halogenase
MKVIIVGGGTAGWISALFFSKIFPNVHDITVVDSSKIGIIGAGEGSTGLLNGVITNQIADFGCNELDFIKETNSTLKLGIRYRNWTHPGSTYVQPIDASYSSHDTPDSHFLFSLIKTGKFEGKPHTMTPLGFLLEENKSTYFKDGVNNIGLHAYHFDAHLVGQYFKKISTAAGVKHIDAEVNDVCLNDNGFIKSIKLNDNTELAADFFVDASGFNQVFIKALGIKWDSFKKYLPVNTALPFQIKFKENEIIEPSTLAQAQLNGWMWRIPVQGRYGSGYVFSDEFTTPDKAQEEIEQTLGHSIDPIRVIKFDSGCLEKFWHKNCLAVGLSSAFLEPLEATSIHTTLMQLWYFVKEFSRSSFQETYSETGEKKYNQRITRIFDDIKNFLVAHYRTGRADTDFWKYVNSDEALTEFTKDIIEICKNRSPTSADFNQYLGSLDWTLWSHVLAGTGNLTAETAAKDLAWHNLVRKGMNSHAMHDYQQQSLLDQLLSNNEFIRKVSND